MPREWLRRLSLSLALLSPPAVLGAGEALLLDDGASAYAIVVADDAAEPEKNAARELQRWLAAVGHVELPLLAAPRDGQPHVFVGPDAARARLGGDAPDFDAFTPDETLQQATGGDLILAGGRPRGTLYAVYEFLERHAGVRFLAPDVTHTPSLGRLALPEETRRYRPPFARRETYFQDVTGANGEAQWRFAAARRLNGYFQDIPEAWGGTDKMLGFCHTFVQLINEKDYFAEHPEWFSLNEKGERVAGHLLGQHCYTNAEMKAEMIRKAKDWMRPHWPRRRFIALSMNDNDVYCRCPDCAASDKRLGNPTDTMIAFVNDLAAALDVEFPGIRVETLAYLYAATPPKTVAPAENVYIRLCDLDNDFSRPVEHPANKTFRDQVVAWNKLAPGRLGIWHYVVNFGNTFTVHPNTLLFERDFRFFRDNGAVMAYAEGDHGGHFGYLRQLQAYVLSGLLWNPDRGGRELVDEFLSAYYGPAAPMLAEFVALVAAEGGRGAAKIGWSEPNATEWFRPSAVARGYKIFARAEAAVAGDATLEDRVRRARMALDWACLDWRARDPKRPGLDAGPDTETLLARLRELFDTAPEKEREGLSRHLARFNRTILLSPASDPLLARVVAGRKCMDFQDFFLYNNGAYGRTFPDPAASDGFAVRFDAGHPGKWGAGVFLWKPEVRGYADLAGKRHFYATMRREGGDPDGRIMTIAVYNRKTKHHGIMRQVLAKECGTDAYTLVDLGVSEVSNDTDVYFELADDAGARHVWIDRLVMVEP